MIWIAALLFIACNRTPTSLEDCDTTECKEQVLVAMWQEDPKGLEARLTAIADPLERLSYVNVLVESFPGETSDLCTILPEGEGRERCERISMRPHLRAGNTVGAVKRTEAEEGAGVAVGGSAASQSNAEITSASDASVQAGPGMTLLIPSNPAAFQSTPWDKVAAVDPTCENAMMATSCRTTASETAAKEGNAYAAAQACLANEPGQWRSECMFHAAEVLVSSVDPEDVGAALELCLGSGDYRANCFAHIAMEVAQLAPVSTNGQPFAWEAVKRAVQSLRADMAPRDPVLGDRIAERVWSEATLVAYRKAARVTGDPIDQVPAEALPHIRAAAAWQMVMLEGSEDRTLAQWNDRLKAALALRVKGGAEAAVELQRPDAVTNLWTELYPGEEILRPVLYLGQARRVWSENPEADGLICILEALARRPGRPIGPFLDGLKSEDQALRWTAGRWIQTLDDGTYIRFVQLSSDPLLRARGSRPAISGGGGGQSGGNSIGVSSTNVNSTVGGGPR